MSAMPLVAHSRPKLLIAAALSVLLHLAAGWGLYDQAIGSTGDLGSAPERFVRVRLAPPERRLPGTSGRGADVADAVATLSLEQLSAALLAADAPAERDPGAAPSFTPAPVTDPLETEAEPAPAVTAAPLEAEQELLQTLVGQLALETPFVAGDGRGTGLAGPGRGGSPGELGGLDVNQLLADAGIAVAPPATAAALAPPRVQEAPPATSEHRPVMPLIRTPPLDLGALEVQAALNPELSQTLDDDFDYAVRVYRPVPRGNERAESGYLRVDVTARRSLRKLTTMPKDVVYVIDVSGSVSQQWVNAALLGVRDALNSLNEGDRFNIVMFSDQPAFFSAEAIQPVSPQTLEAAGRFLGAAQSGGSTDVNRALARLLVRDVAVERVYELVLISDGRPTRGVTGTRDLINIITRDNDLAASIYCVGIGDRQNPQLLEFLAYRNRGFCVFAKTPFEAPQVIRDLASRLRYPIIKNLRVLVSGLDPATVFPSHVPNIHQGETFSVFARFERPETFTMQLVGRGASGEVIFTITRDLGLADPGTDQLAHDWAFWKLHHLYSELLRQGDNAQLRAEIDRLARQYKLKTVY